MIKIDFKPSNRHINQISAIERLCGELAKIELNYNPRVFGNVLKHSANQQLNSILMLESDLPQELLPLISKTNQLNFFKSQILNKQNRKLNLSPIEVKNFFADIISIVDAKYSATFRNTNITFNLSSSDRQEIVFPANSSFLIESRLKELCEWFNIEISSGSYHPLFLIGTFQLLFLQISPFSLLNHSLSLLITNELLRSHGYYFLSFSNYPDYNLSRLNQYINSLRQSEKSAGNSWLTLNIWLEFYLDSLLHALTDLKVKLENSLESSTLSNVQNKIINVIKDSGSASREQIAEQTGIKVSTIKYNLSLLSTKGFLKRQGNGRTTHYLLN